MIYFDNAATTMQKPQIVIDAVTQALSSMGNAGRGAHDASLDASRMIFDTRVKLAEFFHAPNPAQIAFTMNSTESLNIAIKGILNIGDHVITTDWEHNSVLRPLYELEDQGVQVSFVKSDSMGRLQLEDFEKLMQPNTRVIICTHASNLTGNVMDIVKIGELAQKHGILFIVDASQTAGILPIDVQKMHIDVLCFTGHKGLLGPQGTGGLYVNENITIRPLLSGGSGVQTYSRKHPKQMPTALEAGTLNAHGIAGLHAALTYLAETGIDVIRQKEQDLMWYFYQEVCKIPEITVYGDFTTEHRCAIVSLNIGTYDSAEISDALCVDYGILTRAGAHCAPLMHQALKTEEQGAVRFSFSHYNTLEEVKQAVRALHELV